VFKSRAGWQKQESLPQQVGFPFLTVMEQPHYALYLPMYTIWLVSVLCHIPFAITNSHRSILLAFCIQHDNNEQQNIPLVGLVSRPLVRFCSFVERSLTREALEPSWLH